MPFKRPAPPVRAGSSGYSSRSDTGVGNVDIPSKRTKVERSAKVLPEVKLYIAQAKIDGSSLAELFALAERNCKSLCTDIEDANVILTAITMRRRFERHVSWELAVSTKSSFTRTILMFSLENESYSYTELAAGLCRRRETITLRGICCLS